MLKMRDHIVDHGITQQITVELLANTHQLQQPRRLLVYGSTIIIGTTKKHSSGGNISITIDGNSQGNISSSGGADYSGEPTYHPIVTIYTGLTNTTHTVVLTSSISGTSQVDYITALSFPLDGYVNKVYCGGTPRILSTSYDTEADYYNTLCQSAITTISTIGLPVVYSNTPNWYNPREHLAIGSDSFNPSATGHKYIAEKFLMDEKHLKNQNILTVGPFDDCDYKTDGTDDAAQVNEALALVGNNGTVIGYGDLYIAPGNPICVVNLNPTDDANFWSGRDFYGKTLQGPTNSPRGLRLHLSGTAAGSLICTYGKGITVKNMTLIGNRLDTNGYLETAYQAGSYGVYICPTTCTFSNIMPYGSGAGGFYGGILSNIIITDCGDAGIYAPSTAGSLGYAFWHDIWINRCYQGLHFDGGVDLRIHQLTVSNTYKDPILFTGTAGSINLNGAHIWYGANGINGPNRTTIFAAQPNCITLGGQGYYRLTNVVIDQFVGSGIWICSNFNFINGCEFYGAYTSSSTPIYLGAISGGANYNTITGCKYNNTDNTNFVVAKAVVIDATPSKYNVVFGNSWENCTSPYVFNSGGSTNVVANNNGG